MLQFPVPQFIDIEDKLIGPLTLKQFGFILPGGLLIFILFRIFGISVVFFMIAIPVLLITLIIGFGQFNGKPLYNQFGVFVKFLTAPKRYQFNKTPGPLEDLNLGAIDIKQVESEIATKPEPEESTQSRLQRLSLLLDQKEAEEQEIVKFEKK